MVDPKGEVYLISKDPHGRGVLFHLPSTAWTKPGSHSHRVHVTSTTAVPTPSTHPDPVAGDISPNGNEVLVKVTSMKFVFSGARFVILSLRNNANAIYSNFSRV